MILHRKNENDWTFVNVKKKHLRNIKTQIFDKYGFLRNKENNGQLS